MSAAVTKSPTTILDVSALETYAFGSRTPLFWGTALLCCIEGTALAILFTSYFYLRGNFDEWPPSGRIPPVAGSVSAAVLLASLFPTAMCARAARSLDLRRTRRWQLVATVVGVLGLGTRAWEFHALPFQWTENAYASVVWSSLGFHTLDCFAEVVESIVLTAIVFRRGRVENKHFEDIEANAVFWAFLVLVWMPFAGVFYADGAIR